ncbi:MULTISPECIES: hypothetical protein [Streptomyces]|uniref:hypothetical protein n=1 Tax=Streptomyces TaxID=1883 RepID=UPI0004BD3F69|nr:MULTISPECIES: hypothetical protein [Streptomyces]MDI6411873.1 hypothetical protein [Streptomyces albus]
MPGSTLTYVRTAVAALSLAAVGTLGVPAAVAAGAAPEAVTAAQACSWDRGAPPSNLNPYSTTDRAADTAPVRMGPYGDCTKVTSYSAGTSVPVNCYVTNSYGNTWSYVRGSGWVWDAHLSNGGSPHPCRF